MSKKVIGIFVGSLRKASNSRKIAKAIQAITPEGYEFKLVEIGDLPLYNEDYDEEEAETPASYTRFREEVRALNGFIFVTPEYNRSIPAVLKNALDVGTRPKGKGVWGNKPGMVISNSPGSLAGFGANHHLRQCLVVVNTLVMAQPEIYLANITKGMDENGNFDENVKAILQKAVDAFVKWVERVS